MEITDALMAAVLDQSQGVVGMLEAIEISHSKWDSVLRYVNDGNAAITLTHEDNNSYEYQYAQIKITRSSDSDTLDQELSFNFGDLGEIVPKLIDAFILDEEIEFPIVNYRVYLVGAYDAPVLVARNLELDSITRDNQGASCQSKAPSLNENGNGDKYTVDLFPSLIGYY